MDELVDKTVPEAIEGASKSDIRRRFKEWVNINARLECTADISAGQFQTLLRETPRFNFCIHVDADVLDAVIRRGPSLDGTMATVDGYVNLIRADEDWSWDEHDPATSNRRDEGYEEDQDPLDERRK
ncbi:hypothetical protein E4T47_08286 [Aureobasidium subglaciale]|nr:hypothetical protein E4T47_08286 [Aureobasidium subglaciale]